MNEILVFDDVEKACKEIGLSGDMTDQLRHRLLGGLPATRTCATSREMEIMKLLGTASVDQLVHDVRNLLNELALLRAVANLQEE